jgi:diaminopimelate epimerase
MERRNGTIRLNFVKGHMGGNTIVLIHGSQIEKGRELETTLRVLSGEYLSCHEVGILYPPEEKGDLKVKIVGSASKRFISACGGMTQVLGHALVETGIGKPYGISITNSKRNIMLETDGGIVKIEIDPSFRDGKIKVITHMNSFLREIYKEGVNKICLCGICAMQAGKFLVLNADNVKKIFPEVDFVKMDETTKDVLVKIQKEFLETYKGGTLDFALYDCHTLKGGNMRAVFPHDIPGGKVEPSCGTGSVAIAIAVVAAGETERDNISRSGAYKMSLETGGGPELGGPEKTTLFISSRKSIITNVSFSHSFVKITTVGEVLL